MNIHPASEVSGRILLADDHETYRRIICSLLERRGYQVTEASCGDDVLAAAVEQSFDLFVLDYKMPGNEELILIEQLKALQPDIPIIILTGFASLPSAMNAVRLQLFDYIQKGEMPDHLLSRIDEAIQRTRLEKKLRESEDHYRAVVQDMTEVISRFNAEGTITFVNDAYCRFFGKTEAALIGCNWHPVAVPDDIPAIEERLRRLSPENPSVSCENRVYSGSGEVRWMQFVNHAFFNDTGQITEIQSVGRDITDRKQADERYQQLVQHLEAVREEERRRISRELHDDIGQILTALKIDLTSVENGCTCIGEVKDKMADMQKLLSEGIQSIHSLCRRLRPGALDDLGLEDALEGLLDDWKQRNRIECALFADLNDDALSDEIRTTVFRFVQEALTNVSRYAGASEVNIHLVSDDQSLSLSVADNGRGMDPGAADKPTSFGLLGMRERLEALGGSLHITSSPGKGTRIEGTIPLTRNG